MSNSQVFRIVMKDVSFETEYVCFPGVVITSSCEKSIQYLFASLLSSTVMIQIILIFDRSNFVLFRIFRL